ncbi:MAG: M36 family metallopeptidase, partial [Actinomycetota bacterium]
FGKGGVDDAEDAEVIVHEYGHAVHDAQVPGFGSTLESGSIGEAWGDYLAVTVTNVLAPTPDAPCVADWDSTSYTSTVPHCLRRIDGNKHYPADVRGEVHADGEIWSRALWDIRLALGHTKADTLILQSQFSYAPDTTFNAAADATVSTAKIFAAAGKLTAANVTAVRKAFTDRGFTVTQ